MRWRWQIGIGIFEPNGIRLLVREVSHIGHRHTNQTGASVREKRRHSILSFRLDGVSKACWAEPGHFRSGLVLDHGLCVPPHGGWARLHSQGPNPTMDIYDHYRGG